MSYIARDYTINKILMGSHTNWGVTISQIMSYSPTDLAISLIVAKLGFGNKFIIALIIAFLL